MKRRAYLGLLGTGVLAGCSGGDDDSDGTDGTDTTETSTGSPETDGDDGDDSVADPSTVAFSERWATEFESDGVVSGRNFGADATADSLFMGAEWGFAALDMADGSRLWEKNEWEGFIDIHADSDGVVAYTQSFEVVSLNPSDGSERWRKSTAESEVSLFNSALTPSYFVAESADGITVYERSSGAVALELDESPRDILATDDVLVVPTSLETAAYDIPSGDERWTSEASISPGAALDDDRLIGHEIGFGTDADSSLTALDLDSGEERWSENLGSVTLNQASVTTEDGVAMFRSDPFGEASTLYGHSLDDGSESWTRDVGELLNPFDPVSANGVVIAPGDSDGQSQLRAHDVQNGEQLDATEAGFNVTEAVAVDRMFLELELQAVTAHEF